MPIRGITDSVQPGLPRIGKLRKGGEAPRNAAGQVVKMGADLDHFRFTSERPEVQAAFEDAYGATPALVHIYLPYADIERNFGCWKERWAAGGLVHRCDGETMQIWLGPEGLYHKSPKPCDGDCDEVGRLSVIVPELVQAGYVGYVTLETHGINDLLSIQASLLAAAESRAGNDLGLRGIQWNLRRVKEKISTPMGNGKRVRREKWLVKLEPAADWVQLQLQAAHNATMMLPAPSPAAVSQMQEADVVTVDPETGEIIEAAVVHIEPTTQPAQAAIATSQTARATQTTSQPEAKASSKATEDADQPGKPKVTRTEWFVRWHELLRYAASLHIEHVAPLAPDAPVSELTERKAKLEVLIAQAEAENAAVQAQQAEAIEDSPTDEPAF